MTFCIKCGAQIEAEDTFCLTCGANQKTGAQPAQPQYQPPQPQYQPPQPQYQPQYVQQRVEPKPMSPVFFLGLFSAIAAFFLTLAEMLGWMDVIYYFDYYYSTAVTLTTVFVVSLGGLVLASLKTFEEKRLNKVGKIMCLVCAITVLSMDFITFILRIALY